MQVQSFISCTHTYAAHHVIKAGSKLHSLYQLNTIDIMLMTLRPPAYVTYTFNCDLHELNVQLHNQICISRIQSDYICSSTGSSTTKLWTDLLVVLSISFHSFLFYSISIPHLDYNHHSLVLPLPPVLISRYLLQNCYPVIKSHQLWHSSFSYAIYVA